MKTPGLINATDDIRVPSDSVGALVLASSVAQSVVPAPGSHFLVATSDQPFYILFNSTAAAMPTGSATASSTNSEFAPPYFEYKRNFVSTLACTVFSVITPASAGSIFSYQFYS
jgi:hypothetical protein